MNFEDLQKSLPIEIRKAVFGYVWQQNNVGESGAQIFRLTAKNKNSLYLKINSRLFGHSLLPEKLKLDWLKNQLPVPEVLLFVEDNEIEYLLISEISGFDASHDSLKKDVSQTIEQLINGLKLIHQLPIENCPFDERLGNKINAARKRMENNLVDETDFDEIRQGRTAASLFEELLATMPENEELVFTHGDYCLPNVIFENEMLSGFVDWSNAGVADKYQDLALLTRSISYNFGEKWEELLFEIYGVEPDQGKICFYRLLDEFF